MASRKKPSVAPANPMKVFHWSRLQDSRVQATVWKDLSDTRVCLDIPELEQLFGKKAIQKKGVGVGEEKDISADRSLLQTPPSSSSPSFLSSSVSLSALPPAPVLLDGKRTQAVSIMLSQFGTQTTPEAIVEAVERSDLDILTPERVQSLFKNLPGEEEIFTLSEFSGDPSRQSKAEIFLLKLIKIDRFSERIRSFLFQESSKELVDYLVPSYDVVSAAATAVVSSASLRGVLETTLAIGNYLNGGTSSGGAYGFKLDVLQKLAEFRSVDNQTTLLQYVVRKLSEAGVSAAQLVLELEPASAAVKVPLVQLASDMQELGIGLEELFSEITLMQKAASSGTGTGSKVAGKQGALAFLNTAVPFYQSLSETYKKLQDKKVQVEKQMSEVIVLYDEDPKKTPSDEFFKIFASFAANYDRIAKDMNAKEELKRKAEMKYKPSSVAATASLSLSSSGILVSGKK